MLEAKAISRAAGKNELVSDVSFTHEPGRILAVLGPSGSGKTTLLRLLMGLDALDRGTIAWRGNVLSNAEGSAAHVPTEKRRFGMVFQDSALFPHLNVIDNVGFGLVELSRAERKKSAEGWLERFGIRALAKRRIHLLSGGERQRVALARALAPKPEVLLLDEPFNSVDRLARHELIKSLKSTMDEAKTTVIVVTHDARDALELGAESLLVLDKGKLVRSGKVQEVLSSPGSEWNAHFLETTLR